jgi:ferrous iron transport protein B
MTIGFVGNPNCGKTTLFNAYTGAHLKVANWPGVTVEKKEGAMKVHDQTYKLVDLPGTYSLTSYTMEEIVSRGFIVSDAVDVLINVVDASALERNLYLTLQLLELGKPVVLALNMMDIVEKRGMEIDLHRLPEMLGVPVIPVSARKRKGLDVLIHAVAHHKSEPSFQRLTYTQDIEDRIAAVSKELAARYPAIQNLRWHAIKLLEQDEALSAKYPVSPELMDRSWETDITNQKYAYIEAVLEEVLVNRERVEALTDRVDALLTHRVLGLPIFLLIMALIFCLTFVVGDWLKGYFETWIGWFINGVRWTLVGLRVHPILHSLIVDGILAGVGGMLSFLPNIIILFLALALLEDSGYMARVAYVMDGVMGKLGVSGKAFIPMLLGFGCSVPAVMATRSLESRKDRLRMMLVIPFMSCSAKLPIYVLFSGMFFPDRAIWAAYSLYLLGALAAILSAFVMHRLDRDKQANMLIIELPEYKVPSTHTVLIYVWEKVKDYLSRAGTIILLASMVMWGLLNFGPAGYVTDIARSFGASFGRYLTPVLRPIGLGWWQVGVALIAGLSAKEVVVASFAVLFGVANLSLGEGMAQLGPLLGAMGFGALNAYALMVFCLLYPPCLAALAAIRRESGSWRWVGLGFVFQTGMAWGMALLIYRIGLGVL